MYISLYEINFNPLETMDTPVCSLERSRRIRYTPVCSLLAHHTPMTCSERNVQRSYAINKEMHTTLTKTNGMAEFHDNCN